MLIKKSIKWLIKHKQLYLKGILWLYLFIYLIIITVTFHIVGFFTYICAISYDFLRSKLVVPSTLQAREDIIQLYHLLKPPNVIYLTKIVGCSAGKLSRNSLWRYLSQLEVLFRYCLVFMRPKLLISLYGNVPVMFLRSTMTPTAFLLIGTHEKIWMETECLITYLHVCLKPRVTS